MMQQKKDILLESKYPSEIEFTSVGPTVRICVLRISFQYASGIGSLISSIKSEISPIISHMSGIPFWDAEQNPSIIYAVSIVYCGKTSYMLRYSRRY